MNTVTTSDIEQLWQLAFSEPAKARKRTRVSDSGDQLATDEKKIIYNGGDLTMFADAELSDLFRLGTDTSIGQSIPRRVSRLLIQYTGLNLAEVKDYNWQEPVQEAYERAGVKLAFKDDGSLQTMVLAVPSVISDPSGFYLSQFLIGAELTRKNMTDSMQWIYRTGKGLENLAETHNAYNQLKD